LEIGFFSGRWPIAYGGDPNEGDPFGWFDMLVPYYTIDDGGQGWHAPVKQNPGFQVPASSWAELYVISDRSTGNSVASVAPGYSFGFNYALGGPA